MTIKDNANIEEQEVVMISNDKGQQEAFEVLYRFEQDNGNKYILLTPSVEDAETSGSEEDAEQEVYAFRYEDEGENYALTPIEDEHEWDMVEDVLHTLSEELDKES